MSWTCVAYIKLSPRFQNLEAEIVITQSQIWCMIENWDQYSRKHSPCYNNTPACTCRWLKLLYLNQRDSRLPVTVAKAHCCWIQACVNRLPAQLWRVAHRWWRTQWSSAYPSVPSAPHRPTDPKTGYPTSAEIERQLGWDNKQVVKQIEGRDSNCYICSLSV